MKIDISISELANYIAEYKKTLLVHNEEIPSDDLGITISTPAGNSPVNYVIKKCGLDMLNIVLANGYSFRCATHHILRSGDTDVYAANIHVGDIIDHRDGPVTVTSVLEVGTDDCYDINVAAPHLYYDSDGVIHHNTLICAVLSHKVEKYGRSIVIVPTRDLVTQTEEDYRNMGLDVGVFFGSRKEYGKTHTICTWQSLESLNKKSKKFDLEIDIKKFFENVQCVMVDEVHSSKGSTLQGLLSGPLANIPIRWGLTGTMPESELDQVTVLSCFGPEFGKVNTKDLQDKGILAQLNINVLQLQEKHAPLTGNYQAELKWLTTNPGRLKFIADTIAAISESGNTLVLVDRIETGKMLESLIPDSVFVSGEMKSADRKAEYKSVATVDGKVVVATFSVAAVGINIVRIYNLVLIEAGQSFIKVIQSIGRSLRVSSDKTSAEVYDICANTKYSKKHLTKRKKIYAEAQYPYSVKKVTY